MCVREGGIEKVGKLINERERECVGLCVVCGRVGVSADASTWTGNKKEISRFLLHCLNCH